MGKATQATVSKKNPFWIPKNRYYELKYFCLQFWEWQNRRASLDILAMREHREPTETEAMERAELDCKIKMITTAAENAGGWIGHELLTGVTRGLSYDVMNARKLMPCGREKYYSIYRKFFWFLDRERS